MSRILRLALASAALWGSAARADDGPVAAPAELPPGVAADGTASVVAVADAEPQQVNEAEPAHDAAPLPPATGGHATTEFAPPAPPRSPVGATPRDAAVAPPSESANPSDGSATDLLATAFVPPESPATAGATARPLTLLEALQRPGDPSRRLWIAQAYWKVSAAGAWVRWATEAVERLDLVAPGSDPHDRAVLDVATAAARADLADARSQFGVAQQELADLARLPIGEPLPWPVDRPLATPYETHFDAIFATRIATGRTRAIARTLPARHEALEARAAAVTAAGKAMAMAEADHAQGRRPIEAVVAAHAALVGQQREFLAAVRAYNLDIAEYAMAVADVSVPDDRFVSMLIGARTTVQPATFVAPAGPPGPPGTPSTTNASGGGVVP